MTMIERYRHAPVDLLPGQVRTFRLPPMTEGEVVVRASYVLPPGAGDSGDPATPPGPGGLARDNETQPFDPTVPHDGDPPLSGAAIGLRLDLMIGNRVFYSAKPDSGAIYAHNQYESDEWNLRIARPDDGSAGPSTYSIEVYYPSILPLIEKRIPLAFFQHTFDQNWNVNNDLRPNQYFKSFNINGSFFSYELDPHFAALYHLTPHGLFDFNFPGGVVKLPAIEKKDIRFLAGSGPDPITGTPDRAYFAVRVECSYPGSREIEITGLPNITLPANLWFEARFYLATERDGLAYYAQVLSPLFDLLPVSIATYEIRQPAIDRLANKFYQAQHGADGINRFDRFLRPWLIGHRDVYDLRFDAATQEIVIGYAGDPLPRQIANAPDVDTAPPPAPEPGNAPDVGSGPTEEFPALFFTPREVRPPPASHGVPSGPGQSNTYHATPGALAEIEHIVVLMQENRSFDQVLGYLSRDRGLRAVEGLRPGANSPDQVEYARIKFKSQRAPQTSWPSYNIPNPCHDNHCVITQMADGMTGQIANYAQRLRGAGYLPAEGGDLSAAQARNLQRIMDYYDGGQLKAYAALVREFAICDHWFSAHVGPTVPNRHVTLSGDLNRDRDGGVESDNSPLGNYAASERPIFLDHLTERHVGWRVFEHGYSFVRLYAKYTFDTTSVIDFNDPLAGFEASARAGALPSVSFIEPDYIEAPGGNDDHAPADMKAGQHLIARIVKALVEGPLWDKTLFVITYDEHGGFYDHVTPPAAIEVRKSDGTVVSRPIPALANSNHQLGPRVPAFVVSPLIDRGAAGVNVSKTVFDHTTIGATILRRFCSPNVPRMSPRMDAANDLRELVTRAQARPRSDFNQLLADLDRVIADPIALAADPPPSPSVRMAIADPGRPDDHLELEDFHGFIAFASSVTGRSPPKQRRPRPRGGTIRTPGR